MSGSDILSTYIDNTARKVIEKEDNLFIDLLHKLSGVCNHCKTAGITHWHEESITERHRTQATGFGGNEETWDITYKIISCPMCRHSYEKEETGRTFVTKGWI